MKTETRSRSIFVFAMKKHLPLVQKITTLLIAAILAGVAARFGGADKWTLSILALVTGIVVDSIFNFIRTEHALKRMDETIAALAHTMAKEERQRLAELEALAISAHDIPDEKMPSVWKQLNWAVTESYCATNYIDPADIYGPQQAKDVFKIQEAKAKADQIPVKKVLIVNSETELESAINRELVAHHLAGGIQLHWIKRDRIEACAELRKFPAELRDFAIIDSRIVLIWKLSKVRKVTGGEIRVGAKACRPFVDFFKALHNEASADFSAVPAAKTP